VVGLGEGLNLVGGSESETIYVAYYGLGSKSGKLGRTACRVGDLADLLWGFVFAHSHLL
jgi:hypothetical protein